MDDEEVDKRRPADAEMARVLKTTPVNIVSGLDPYSGGIAHWKHGALHDVVQPMADHVIMTYIDTLQPLERRTGRSTATGVARPGVVTIIPAGTSARWDIGGAVDVVQLYLPQATIDRVAAEADNASPAALQERTGHPDPITSRLLTTAAEALEGNTTLACNPLVGSARGDAGRASAGVRRAASQGFAPRIGAPSLGERCRRLAGRPGCRRRAVTLSFLPRIQGKYRDAAACLAPAVSAGAGQGHVARSIFVDHRRCRGARLCVTDRFRRGVQEAGRRVS
jgi:hypothetical protein